MFRRIAAITFIFVCTAVAWVILGATIFERTYSADDTLRGRVISLWGAPHVQFPPAAVWEEKRLRTMDSTEDGKRMTRTAEETVAHTLPLVRTDASARIALEHRRKGLLWYSTYKVNFAGEYAFRSAFAAPQQVRLTLPLPAKGGIYDDLFLEVNGARVPVTYEAEAAAASVQIPAGETILVRAGYRSQGLDRWTYRFAQGIAEARDFRLRISTDFGGFDFPDDAISPTEKQPRPDGWDLTWAYANLVTGSSIALAMPQKLQPGPLAGRISLFAPVSLFFFFFLMFLLTTLRGIELHPMNYFFLAAAFFAFHLLLAYLVDHVTLLAAFLLSAAVSVLLVVSYLRLVVGTRFALVEAGLSQVLYLVLFSAAFFLEGFTGLTVTIGSIVTLFVVMQMTGRIRWAEYFAPKPAAPAASGK
jgi:hypothetical protein